MSNNILNTTATNQYNYLSTCGCKDDDAAYSNSKFDLHFSDLLDFVGSAEKDDTDNHLDTAASQHAQENNTTVHCATENYFF